MLNTILIETEIVCLGAKDGVSIIKVRSKLDGTPKSQFHTYELVVGQIVMVHQPIEFHGTAIEKLDTNIIEFKKPEGR